MPVRLGLFPLLPKEDRERWLNEVAALSCSEIMTKKPTTVSDGSSLADSVHLMNREKRKRLPVLDSQGFLVGMLSRIDVLKAIATTRESLMASHEVSVAASTIRLVRDIEPRDAFSLREDASIKEAIDGLIQHGLQRAAIVDKDDKLVGLVTDEILVRAIGGGAPRRLPFGLRERRGFYARPVSSVMKRDIKTVGEDVPIDEAIRLMTEFGLKRIPVIDANRKYHGMIRRDSILLALAHTY
jgi:CBS domain-containing protein